MKTPIREYYLNKISNLENEINSKQIKLRTLTLLRLLTFLIFSSLSIFSIGIHNYLGLIPTVLALALFLWHVNRHKLLKQGLEIIENTLIINQNEHQVLDGQSSIFNELGLPQNNNPLSRDLDLLGNNSLFNFTFRGVFNEGKIAFANDLISPEYNSKKLISLQKAHEELSEKIEFRQNFLALSLKNPKADYKTMEAINGLSNLTLPSVRIPKALVYGLAAINCFIIGYFVYLSDWGIAGLFALIPWVITWILGKHLIKWQRELSKTNEPFSTLKKLLGLIKKEDFNSGYLKDLQETSTRQMALIKTLKKLSSSFDRKLNGAAYLFNNTLFFSDLFLLLNCQEALKKLSKSSPEGFGNLGEWEKLNSMATFQFNHPHFCTPSFTDQIKISSTDLGHPLIPVELRVGNDFESEEGPHTYLITGSNMSGKSTFLRALGINQVLALAGGVVCAKTFTTPVIPILTHLRVDDSLNQQTSYFKAELDRLKSILESLAGGPSLVLIDEMLRGTNSEDKMMGSQKYIERISKIPSLTFVASHDLSLGELSDTHQNISNICFESEIKDNNLFFDYKLKSGLAKNKNATWLMKKMNIIP